MKEKLVKSRDNLNFICKWTRMFVDRSLPCKNKLVLQRQLQMEREEHEEMIKLHGQHTVCHVEIVCKDCLTSLPREPTHLSLLLSNSCTKHTQIHDCKSFHYVLLYIVIMYVGPDDQQRCSGPLPYFINDWLHPEQYQDQCLLGNSKIAHKVLSDELYNKRLMEGLCNYMKPLAPCLKKIHALLCDDQLHSFTHDAFLEILDKPLSSLPDELADLYKVNKNTTLLTAPSGKHNILSTSTCSHDDCSSIGSYTSSSSIPSSMSLTPSAPSATSTHTAVTESSQNQLARTYCKNLKLHEKVDQIIKAVQK